MSTTASNSEPAHYPRLAVIPVVRPRQPGYSGDRFRDVAAPTASNGSNRRSSPQVTLASAGVSLPVVRPGISADLHGTVTRVGTADRRKRRPSDRRCQPRRAQRSSMATSQQARPRTPPERAADDRTAPRSDPTSHRQGDPSRRQHHGEVLSNRLPGGRKFGRVVIGHGRSVGLTAALRPTPIGSYGLRQLKLLMPHGAYRKRSRIDCAHRCNRGDDCRA